VYVSEPTYSGRCSTLKIKQPGIGSQRSHLDLISLPEAGRWDRWSRKGSGRRSNGSWSSGGGRYGLAEVVDGTGVTGASEVGGGVVAVAGVEGAEERGREARRRTR
jgi:hypothetical protein